MRVFTAFTAFCICWKLKLRSFLINVKKAVVTVLSGLFALPELREAFCNRCYWKGVIFLSPGIFILGVKAPIGHSDKSPRWVRESGRLKQFADIVYRFWLQKRSRFENFRTINSQPDYWPVCFTVGAKRPILGAKPPNMAPLLVGLGAIMCQKLSFVSKCSWITLFFISMLHCLHWGTNPNVEAICIFLSSLSKEEVLVPKFPQWGRRTLTLTVSSPAVSNVYTPKCSGPYWSNPSFLIFWHSDTLAGVLECQKIRKGGLDQYGAERFGRLVFATVRRGVWLKGLKLLFIARPIAKRELLCWLEVTCGHTPRCLMTARFCFLLRHNIDMLSEIFRLCVYNC